MLLIVLPCPAQNGRALGFVCMYQKLGGREWTIDGSGELLVVDRPRGDTMPKTVVTALYNFRDVASPAYGDKAAESQTGEHGGKGSGRNGESHNLFLSQGRKHSGSARRFVSSRAEAL